MLLMTRKRSGSYILVSLTGSQAEDGHLQVQLGQPCPLLLHRLQALLAAPDRHRRDMVFVGRGLLRQQALQVRASQAVLCCLHLLPHSLLTIKGVRLLSYEKR